jgi:hypothetical protein
MHVDNIELTKCVFKYDGWTLVDPEFVKNCEYAIKNLVHLYTPLSNDFILNDRYFRSKGVCEDTFDRGCMSGTLFNSRLPLSACGKASSERFKYDLEMVVRENKSFKERITPVDTSGVLEEIRSLIRDNLIILSGDKYSPKLSFTYRDNALVENKVTSHLRHYEGFLTERTGICFKTLASTGEKVLHIPRFYLTNNNLIA